MAEAESDQVLRTEIMLQQALQKGHVEIYSPRTQFYHCGLYSDATTLWSHSPTLLLPHSGHYLVTTVPADAVRLAILPKADFDTLWRAAADAGDRMYDAIEKLCALLTRYKPELSIDGFASYRLEGGIHYRYIILFRPLQSMALKDLEMI